MLESDPFRRLAYTWHSFTPDWAEALGVDPERQADAGGGARRSASFDLEPVGDISKLTVVHEFFQPRQPHWRRWSAKAGRRSSPRSKRRSKLRLRTEPTLHRRSGRCGNPADSRGHVDAGPSAEAIVRRKHSPGRANLVGKLQHGRRRAHCSLDRRRRAAKTRQVVGRSDLEGPRRIRRREGRRDRGPGDRKT